MVPLILDTDDMLISVVRLGVPDLVLGASTGGSYFASFVSALPVAQVPARPGWGTADLGFSSSAIATQGPANCSSLLFQKAGSSFLLDFNSDGSIKAVQSLVPSTVGGMDISALVSKAGDVNGDGRQDLTLSFGGATRAVMLAQPDGTLRVDASASVIAVWNSFVAACAAGNRQGAVNHLWGGTSNGYANALLDTANDITQLSRGIVAVETVATSSTVYAVNVIYQHTSPAEYVAYKLDAVLIGGVWYLQSM